MTGCHMDSNKGSVAKQWQTHFHRILKYFPQLAGQHVKQDVLMNKVCN